MYLLASEKVPNAVSKFIAGGNLVALSKYKPVSPPYICPIAVGETSRCLVNKCLRQIIKMKASEFFFPPQMGVACQYGLRRWYMV